MNIMDWFGSNALKLNVKKSKCLVVAGRAELRLIDKQKGLQVQGQLLEFVDSYNYLGYIMTMRCH